MKHLLFILYTDKCLICVAEPVGGILFYNTYVLYTIIQAPYYIYSIYLLFR